MSLCPRVFTKCPFKLKCVYEAKGTVHSKRAKPSTAQISTSCKVTWSLVSWQLVEKQCRAVEHDGSDDEEDTEEFVWHFKGLHLHKLWVSIRFL